MERPAAPPPEGIEAPPNEGAAATLPKEPELAALAPE
jgi:hypothetical protein